MRISFTLFVVLFGPTVAIAQGNVSIVDQLGAGNVQVTAQSGNNFSATVQAGIGNVAATSQANGPNLSSIVQVGVGHAQVSAQAGLGNIFSSAQVSVPAGHSFSRTYSAGNGLVGATHVYQGN